MASSGNNVDLSGSGPTLRGVTRDGIGINRAPPPANEPSIEEAMAEARARPLDFPAAERAAYIRTMSKRAAEYRAAGRSQLEIARDLLPEFARDYPYLFEMCTQEGGYDASMLNTMITMLDKMGSGVVNHHQATVIVGQRLAQRYIRGDQAGAGAGQQAS